MTRQPAAGFLALTEITDPDQHRSYNAWHQLDHLPEQLPLDGVLAGQRWVSTPACTARRAAGSGPLGNARYFTMYLMTEPLERTFDDFASLAEQLTAAGRFHGSRNVLLSGAYDLCAIETSPRLPLSPVAAVLRPNRGVYLIVAPSMAGPETVDVGSHLIGVPGVAAVVTFDSRSGFMRDGWNPGSRRFVVAMLDDEPLEVAERVRPLLDEQSQRDGAQPDLAGPFETIQPWKWDWFDQPG
jgi:hypothetical protein